MNKITGSIFALLCFAMLFCLSVAGQGVNMNKAENIKVAFETLPYIEEGKEYSQQETSAIKTFIDLWEEANQETKDFVYSKYNISKKHFTDYKNLYISLTSAVDITLCSIKPIKDCAFNGIKQMPEITVDYSGSVLEINKDYTVQYQNNKNVGLASVIIRGMGRFVGSKTVNFNITPTKISGVSVNPINNKIYTGKRIKPNLKITFGSYTLVKSVDYKAFYFYNKNVGSAKVIIKGKGNFRGDTSCSFKIVKRAITSAKVYGLQTRTFKGNVITPKIKIKLKGRFLKEGRDYNISVSGNQRVGNATVRINATGNYKGKLVRYFKIVPAKVKNITYTKWGILKWSEVQGATKYEISYSKFENMKNAKTLVVSKNSLDNVKLKGKYIKITATKIINGVTFKGKPTKIKIQ